MTATQSIKSLRDQHHRENYGFVSKDDLADILEANRLELLLVRYGCGRLLAPAQNITQIVAMIEGSGDYVRDVSWPAKGGE